MAKEYLYYDRVLTRKLPAYPAPVGAAPFFGLFLIVPEGYCYENLRSVLAQTYTNFSLVLLAAAEKKAAAEAALREAGLTDPRIRVEAFSSAAQLDSLFPAETQYLFQLSAGMRLDVTLLTLLFSALTAQDTPAEIVLTDRLDYQNKVSCTDWVASAKHREIWLPGTGFLFHRRLLQGAGLNGAQELTPTAHDVDVLHLDFYGVWDTGLRRSRFALTGKYRFFPRSSDFHFFETDPTETEFALTPIASAEEKTLLCILPWAKIGGADKFNLNVLSYLKAQGYRVFAVSTEVCPYEARQDMEDAVEAYYDLTTFLERKYWPDFVCSLIRTQNIRVIFQSSSLYGYHLLPWLKNRFPQIPIFDYVHMEDFFWRNGGYPRDSNAVAPLLEKTYTCNAHLAELMLTRMHRPTQNVETLYIGVDTDLFDPAKVEITDEETRAFCEGKHMILYPSRFVYEKRPLFLIRLMAELCKRRDDVVCVMVGGGAADADIRAQIAQYQLEDKVRIISLCPNIRQYYKMASVTLICSLLEGLTLTTYESLAMGVPVITSDVGGQKEVVNDSNGAVVRVYQDIRKDVYNYDYSPEELQEYMDAVERVFAADYDRAALRENIVRNFSYHKLYASFQAIVDELMENGSRVDPALSANRELAARYLVLFNEATRVYYDNPIPDTAPLERFGQRMYRHAWYRAGLRVAKALKLNVLLKKIYHALAGRRDA